MKVLLVLPAVVLGASLKLLCCGTIPNTVPRLLPVCTRTNTCMKCNKITRVTNELIVYLVTNGAVAGVVVAVATTAAAMVVVVATVVVASWSLCGSNYRE